MGKPCQGLVVDIIDDDGRVLEDDEIGHIGVKIADPYPPSLFTG